MIQNMPTLGLEGGGKVLDHPVLAQNLWQLQQLFVDTIQSEVTSVKHQKDNGNGLAITTLCRCPKVRSSNPPLGTLGNVSENLFSGLPKSLSKNMGICLDHEKVPRSNLINQGVTRIYTLIL